MAIGGEGSVNPKQLVANITAYRGQAIGNIHFAPTPNVKAKVATAEVDKNKSKFDGQLRDLLDERVNF